MFDEESTINKYETTGDGSKALEYTMYSLTVVGNASELLRSF